MTRRTTLRTIAGAAAYVIAGLAKPFLDRAATDLTFMLLWLADGSNVIAFVANMIGAVENRT
jgi:hypothetical protein